MINYILYKNINFKLNLKLVFVVSIYFRKVKININLENILNGLFSSRCDRLYKKSNNDLINAKSSNSLIFSPNQGIDINPLHSSKGRQQFAIMESSSRLNGIIIRSPHHRTPKNGLCILLFEI